MLKIRYKLVPNGYSLFFYNSVYVLGYLMGVNSRMHTAHYHRDSTFSACSCDLVGSRGLIADRRYTHQIRPLEGNVVVFVYGRRLVLVYYVYLPILRG